MDRDEQRVREIFCHFFPLVIVTKTKNEREASKRERDGRVELSRKDEMD